MGTALPHNDPKVKVGPCRGTMYAQKGEEKYRGKAFQSRSKGGGKGQSKWLKKEMSMNRLGSNYYIGKLGESKYVGKWNGRIYQGGKGKHWRSLARQDPVKQTTKS